MELDDKLEERKRGNTHFLAAFEHVRTMLGLSKGKMCEKLNVKPPRLSEWAKGEKTVPEPVKYELINLSVQENIGQISIDYLDGYTDIMLLPNIPDDELAEIQMRRNNPDYDKLKAIRESKLKDIEGMTDAPSGHPTPSSIINANLAQQAESVEAFRIALLAKDDVIANLNARIVELQKTIADKDSIINARDTEIIELKRKLSTLASADLDHYPFTIGAADTGTQQPNRIK